MARDTEKRRRFQRQGGDMRRSAIGLNLVCAALIGVVGTGIVSTTAAAQDARAVTFTKDVAPIFHAKCGGCHRPGEMGPMSLLTYQDARPWARSIKNKVSRREMPPWAIDRSTGIQRFKNDRSLSETEIATIVRWVDAGAPEGSRADMPKPPEPSTVAASSDGWLIGKPDLVVMQKEPFKMYAAGSDWWETFAVDTGLTEDRWIKTVQMRPGNAKIVHHFCAAILPPGGRPGGGTGVVGPPDQYAEEELRLLEEERQLAGESNVGNGTPSFGCYIPGRPTVELGDGKGILLKAGSKLAFQMHYSASGEEGIDQSSVGLVFYPKDTTPKHQVMSAYFQKFPAFELDIPPHSRVEHDAYFPLQKPTRLLSFTPHMHMRGAGLVLEAILPTGRVLTLAAVDRYDFNWQIEYIFDDDVAPLLPAGTMLHAIVIHDNTSANPRNPDPNRWVGYGQASSEEMAGTFVSWLYLDNNEYRRQSGERRARTRATTAQQQ
jgi:mono/diheme cytochrome c family protein